MEALSPFQVKKIIQKCMAIKYTAILSEAQYAYEFQVSDSRIFTTLQLLMQNSFEDFSTLSHLVQYLINSPTIYQ